jgi:hypothetical protein
MVISVLALQVPSLQMMAKTIVLVVASLVVDVESSNLVDSRSFPHPHCHSAWAVDGTYSIDVAKTTRTLLL